MCPSTLPARRYDVDALRVIAILLLIPFHTARLFDAEPWHIKDLSAPFWAADVLVRFLNVAQMPLLFLLAGMSAAWALQRRTRVAFAKERAARLLTPLVVGMFVLVAPQVWVERISPDVPLRMSPIDFQGSFLAFFGSYPTCCYPAGNLSWHHLWFLLYLFVYSVPLLVLPRGRDTPSLARLVERAPWLLFLPGLWLICVEMALRPAFPSTHNLIWDWANHAHYLSLVVIGWWIGRNPGLGCAIDTLRRGTLAGALGLTALWLAALDPAIGGFGVIDLPRISRLAARIAAEWCWLLALLAYGRRALSKPLPGLQAFVPLALPFYLFHQTIIVLLGWIWVDWTGAAALKAAAIAAIATIGSLVLSVLAAQFTVTRIATGLPRRSAKVRVPERTMPLS